MEHYGIPGVSIAVISNHEVVWSKAYGVMDKESKEPVTLNTLFQAGSISKPVASYGALSLADKKEIDMDENVNTYLTSWKIPDNDFTDKKKVGLKHLVSHTGGLTVHGFLGYSPDLAVPSLIEVLNGASPANSPAIFVDKLPEESFRYSGGGYTVMQQMMIDLKEKSYPELMNDLVLSPLEMKNSTYEQPLSMDKIGMAATGYLPDGSMTKGKRHTYPEMAAAGLWTTSEDLARFAIDVQTTYKGTSEKVLSKEMVHQMLTPFVEEFVGLGLFLNKKGDAVYFGHGGWDEGFSSELIAHKTKGYGVVVLTNSNHPDFISELIRSVALTYDWESYVPVYENLLLNKEDIAAISGRYKIHNDDLLEVYGEADKLYVKHLGQEPDELIRISDSTYISREKNEPIQFKSDLDTKNLKMVYWNPSDKQIISSFKMMSADEKVPLEMMASGNYEKALSAYMDLQSSDKNDEAVSENRLNRKGYNLISENNIELAQAIFKVNMKLYPESANVYDSYAEACMLNKEYKPAIENYRKSLELNPQNQNAQNMIDKMQREM
jgi:CubicO group peptidase (beta-lactamase class C family)